MILKPNVLFTLLLVLGAMTAGRGSSWAEIVTAPGNDGICYYIDLKDDRVVGRNGNGTLIGGRYKAKESDCEAADAAKASWSKGWKNVFAFCSLKYPLLVWGVAKGDAASGVTFLNISREESPPYVMLPEYHAYLYLCHGLGNESRSNANPGFTYGYDYDVEEYQSGRLSNRIKSARQILDVFR